MSAHLDELYFDWLYGQVCSVRATNPSRTYRELLYTLYTKEFVWLVPNDDNRVEDGIELRRRFFIEEGFSVRERDWFWHRQPCSILEMLIALSHRLEFQTGDSVKDWFWELLANLRLDKCNDRRGVPAEEVEDILNRLIWRTYEYNGGGGLFPLVYPEYDQRKVEIWQQLNAYIFERGR